MAAARIGTRLAVLYGALALLAAVAAAQAETTGAPAETTAALAETTGAPAETTAAPAETTAAPAETTAAPAETTAALAQATAEPAAETTAVPALTTGLSDLPRGGACKAALERFCALVEWGDGRKAHCLRAEAQAGAARKEQPLSDSCRLEMREFFVAVAKGEVGSPLHDGELFKVLPVPGVFEACADDAWMLCPQKTGPELLRCLRRQRQSKALSNACGTVVANIIRQSSQSIRLDRPLMKACKDDLRDIPECHELPLLAAPGKKTACLKRHSKELSQGCKSKLFTRSIEASEDIRFDADVYRFCRAEVSSFCKDMEFGEARMMKCLWEKRNTPTFSHQCRSRVIQKTRHSLKDYRLDWRIRTRCVADIGTLCHDIDSAMRAAMVDEPHSGRITAARTGMAGEVLHCLKANLTKIKSPQCSNEVKRVIRMQSEDAQADPMLMRGCNNDIKEFCADAENLHNCLRMHLKELSAPCRKAEMLQGSLESRHIQLKPVLQRHCAGALRKFCSDAADGLQAIQCLQDKAETKGFPWACQQVVEADLEASNQDWRLKFGIATECKDEVERLCVAEAKVGGGQVLTCLKQNHNKISDKACMQEMRRYMQQGANNIKFAPRTYEQCAEDVVQFCSSVNPGEGRVHRCLLKHQSELSAGCAKAEFEEQRIISENIQMSPLAKRACHTVQATLCKNVDAGKGQMWQCLEDKKDAWGMTLPCRAVVTAREQMKNFEFYLNPNLANRCEAEAQSFCPTEMVLADYKDFSSEGAVIKCLTKHLHELQDEGCKNGLVRKQVQRVSNLSNSAEAIRFCGRDIDSFCAQTKGQGRGKELKCLWDHHANITKPCLGVVTRMQAMKSRDIRLNPKMKEHCAAAMKEFCGDIPIGKGGGKGRTIACLLKHMHEDSIDQDCRKDLEMEQLKRSKSIRFNPMLKSACESDLTRLQGIYSNEKCPLQDSTTFNGASITCLTTHRSEVKAPACKGAIHHILRRRSNDWRANMRLRKSCAADTEVLCRGIHAGKGRVLKCLRENKANIKSHACLVEIGAVKAAETEDSTLNPAIRGRCQTEMKVFCDQVERGGSRMLTCLTFHRNETAFGAKCAQALTWSQLRPKANLTAAFQQKQKIEAKALTREVVHWLESHRNIWDKWAGVIITASISLVTMFLGFMAYFILQWNRRKNKEAYTVVVAKEMEA